MPGYFTDTDTDAIEWRIAEEIWGKIVIKYDVIYQQYVWALSYGYSDLRYECDVQH